MRRLRKLSCIAVRMDTDSEMNHGGTEAHRGIAATNWLPKPATIWMPYTVFRFAKCGRGKGRRTNREIYQICERGIKTADLQGSF